MPSSVVFWNIWGHRDPEGIHAYIREQNGIDLFCLTEVTYKHGVVGNVPRLYSSTTRDEPASFVNGFQQLYDEFRDQFNLVYGSPYYSRFICKKTEQICEGVGFGSALMFRKGLHVFSTGSTPILQDEPGARGRLLQHVAYRTHTGKRYLVVHLHGVWLEHNTKGDDAIRDRQSQIALKYIESLASHYEIDRIIFGGDLNLHLETRAIASIEQGLDLMGGLRNLIRENRITNTRTPRYRKYGLSGEPLHADYVFVTPCVNVHEFKVMNDVLGSDHAPVHITFT